LRRNQLKNADVFFKQINKQNKNKTKQEQQISVLIFVFNWLSRSEGISAHDAEATAEKHRDDDNRNDGGFKTGETATKSIKGRRECAWRTRLVTIGRRLVADIANALCATLDAETASTSLCCCAEFASSCERNALLARSQRGEATLALSLNTDLAERQHNRDNNNQQQCKRHLLAISLVNSPLVPVHNKLTIDCSLL
jgi:hypothetical protein